MITNQTYDCDVLIIGGGIVGSAFAAALADFDLKIIIVDAQIAAPVWNRNNYHHRVSAINLASQKFLAQLNVWPIIEKMRFSPYREMKVWDTSGIGEIFFNSTNVNVDNLGYIIENDVINAALHQQLALKDNVTLLYGVKPAQLIYQLQHVQINLDNGAALTARLIVGADGARSWIREQINVRTSTSSYEQQALVTTVRTEKSHQLTAWQCFLSTGTLAFLPLVDLHLCSIVWSAQRQEAERLRQLNEADFNKTLTEAFGKVLGKVESLQPVHSFDLCKSHAQTYVGNRVALIGDAAHVIHPLAGQGLNLGLMDAMCLAHIILDTHNKKLDIGHEVILRRYQRWRKGENVLMMTAMDAFKHLFTAKHPWLKAARNLGLAHINKALWLKKIFMRHALGVSQSLPK